MNRAVRAGGRTLPDSPRACPQPAPEGRLRLAIAAWRRLVRAAAAGFALLAAAPGAADAAPGAVPPAALADGYVFVEGAFTAQSSWVQAQAIYTLRLWQAVSFAEPEFTPPRARLAEFRPLGEARVSEAWRGGRRYRVIERRYAVLPFSSGELVAEGAAVSGLMAGDDGRLVRRTLAPPPARLTVLPMPAGATPSDWLPARALAIVETVAPPAEARRGEPFVWTLRVTATGVDAAQIPELSIAPAGFSAHASPPRLHTVAAGDWLVGTRETQWRITPHAAGRLTLPELRLRWWDAGTGAARVATLPARRVTVVAGEAIPAIPPTAARSGEAAAIAAATVDPAAKPGAAAGQAMAIAEPAQRKRWPAFGTAALAGLGLAVLGLAVLAFVARRRLRAAGRAWLAWRRLVRACRGGDPRAVRDALLAWAAARGLKAPTLGALAERAGSARALLLWLDRRCYGPPAAPWHAAGLPQALRRDSSLRRAIVR